MLGKELERDRALQFDIERAVHDAHTPGSGQAEDLVFPDEISRGQSGDGVRHRASPMGINPMPNARSDCRYQEAMNPVPSHEDTLPHFAAGIKWLRMDWMAKAGVGQQRS